MRLISIFLAAMLLGSLQAGGRANGKLVVFQIPVEVETYSPITADNIEQTAFKVVYVKDEKLASEIVSLIQQTSQDFDPKRVRIKITTGHKFFVFDSNGIGVASTGEHVKIDIKAFKMALYD